MTEYPSALELEFLSDSELLHKLSEVIGIIKVKQNTQDDDRDEQDFYQELEAERVRRQLPSAHNK
jgi:hypothetical protein